MTPIQKEKLSSYETLKIAAKELDTKIEELKLEITEMIPDGATIKGLRGEFFIQIRNDWKYGPDLTRQENALKQLKKEEQAKGIAEAIPKKVLVYKEFEKKSDEE